MYSRRDYILVYKLDFLFHNFGTAEMNLDLQQNALLLVGDLKVKTFDSDTNNGNNIVLQAINIVESNQLLKARKVSQNE